MAELFVNDPGTYLTTGCTSSATTITVVNPSGYPTSGNFRIKIDDELMLVTGVSGAVWTVTRGIESTTATSHIGGAAVNHTFTAGAYTQALADRKCYVVFRAALQQAGVASIGFSYPSTGAPTATTVTGTNGVSAAATFKSGQLNVVHDHFLLPSDWASPLSMDILWRTTATTGNCTWELKVAAFGDGDPFEPSTYNTTSTATVAANATGSDLTLTTISGIDTTGFAANKVCYFRLARRGDTDTLAADADLFSVRFIMSRTTTP